MSHPLGQNGRMEKRAQTFRYSAEFRNNQEGMKEWLERTETVLLLALWGTVLWLCLKVAFWVLSLLRSGFMILVDALR